MAFASRPDFPGAQRAKIQPEMRPADTNSPDVLVEYRSGAEVSLGPDVLGAVSYGSTLSEADDRVLPVGLRPYGPVPAVEVWRAPGPVQHATEGAIRFAWHGSRLFGHIQVDELSCGGIREAAELAYREILDFSSRGDHPHLLRMWNYVDAINQGTGDGERYKQFCVGRERGLGSLGERSFPAGTAVGKRDGSRLLQICWLSSDSPGAPLENPRQIAAYRYPRQYGPTPPSFCRAMLSPNGQLMISGTASIVGSESLHPGNPAAQLRETAVNLRGLLDAAARRYRGAAPNARFVPIGTKIYLRAAETPAELVSALAQELGPLGQVLVLEADICRSELLLEIESVYGHPSRAEVSPALSMA